MADYRQGSDNHRLYGYLRCIPNRGSVGKEALQDLWEYPCISDIPNASYPSSYFKPKATAKVKTHINTVSDIEICDT